MLDLVGVTLGHYRITEQLGRGGMAVVYKAFHPGLSVDRAIKVIRPDLVQAESFRERFQREAQAVAGLRHANIVTVHDFGEQAGIYYMVMEFIRGSDLKKWLQLNGSMQPLERAVQIVAQIADALDAAHSAGLLHRDIKCENIMLNEQGMPILMDFGIAKLLSAKSQLTQTGFGIGTPVYMAPEQAKGSSTIGPQADIYSLTVVLYELLTGQVPYQADTPMAVVLKALHDPLPLPRSINPRISDALQKVILKGAAKDPAHRYATAREFREALLAVPAEAPARAWRSMPTDTTQTAVTTAVESKPAAAGWIARRKGLAAAVGGVMLCSVAAALWFAKDRAEPTLSGVPVEQSIAVSELPQPAASEATLGPDLESMLEPEPVIAPVESADAGPVVPAEVLRAPVASDAAPAVLESEPPVVPAQPTVAQGAALNFGEFRRGRLSGAGARIRFPVDMRAGDTLYFDHIRGAKDLRYTLASPTGESLVFESRGDYGPFEVASSGRYALEVHAPQQAESDYEFILWRLAEPVIAGGEIRLGDFVRGSTVVPGQTVRFEYQARAGDRLDFMLLEASEPTDFRLLAPDGRTEAMQTSGDQRAVALPQTGRYTLLARPRGDKLSDFEFQLLPSRR